MRHALYAAQHACVCRSVEQRCRHAGQNFDRALLLRLLLLLPCVVQVLPSHIIHRLALGQAYAPEHHEQVRRYFC